MILTVNDLNEKRKELPLLPVPEKVQGALTYPAWVTDYDQGSGELWKGPGHGWPNHKDQEWGGLFLPRDLCKQKTYPSPCLSCHLESSLEWNAIADNCSALLIDFPGVSRSFVPISLSRQEKADHQRQSFSGANFPGPSHPKSK